MTHAYLNTLSNSFTQTPADDGKPAQLFHLHNDNGMTASFMDIGATWLSTTLKIDGQRREVLLRAKDLSEHFRCGAYMGATAGRFANRIKQGQFSLNNTTYALSQNSDGNCLHGGSIGFDRQRWQVQEYNDSQIIFTYHSPDQEQGFPGNLVVTATYTLSNDNTLTVEYQAHSDTDTFVNLTNHAYFNLAEQKTPETGLQHHLSIAASHYLPTDKAIPTGEQALVSETSFDFRIAKSIGKDLLSDTQQQQAQGYDHCFIFDKAVGALEKVARLDSPDQKLSMSITTTKPAIQFYSGNYLAGIQSEVNGNTQTYSNHAGMALETQYFPDGPNHPEWQQCNGLLKAGEQYHHTTAFQFEIANETQTA